MRKKKIKGFIILMVVTMISAALLNGAEAEAASKPKQTTIKTVSASGTTSVKITVKKKSGVTGYQLRYSTKSSMKGSKTTGRFKSASKKISKLKAGTKYYVQVRTYNKTGKKYKYSGWSAKKSVVTKIAPTTIKSVNASGTTSVKVTVNKKSGVTGYQVRYSTSSGMKSAKSAGAFTGTSKTISSLKAGTKYYVQVRTYKKIDSKKYYSTWSAAKSVTTKVEVSDNSGSGSASDSGTSSSSGTTSGESNKTPEADSSSGGSAGTGETGAVSEYSYEYSYEISLLPNKCGYYNNQNIAVYIKTDDPGVSYYDISGAEFDVITSSYDDIIKDNYSRVSDGYVCILKFKYSGYQTLYINIFDPISGTYTRIPETEFTFTLQDYESSRTAWLQNTMEEVTNDSMTDNEKLTALMVYVRNHFVYDYVYRDTDNPANLYYYSGPWWVRDYNDCWDATDIMCYFANMLGLTCESTDASDLPGAGLWHTVATVYIDGTAYTYDATPLKQGYIDEWNILVQ